MKSLKLSLFSLLATVVAVIGMSFTSNVANAPTKVFTVNSYIWNTTTFTIGDPSTPLGSGSNYTTGTPSGGGSSTFDGADAIYNTAPNQPTQQEVATAIKAEYDRLVALDPTNLTALFATFKDGYQFTGSHASKSFQIKIYLQ